MADRTFKGDQAVADTDKRLHGKIIDFINQLKTHYFDHPELKDYISKVDQIKALVDQQWVDKTQRFGLIGSLMRGAYDNYVDSFTDMFDVDNLVVVRADLKKHEEFASSMTTYIDRLLRRVQYTEHLNQRFAYIPDYGWSIAYDSYKFSEGFQTKPMASTAIPGMESLEFKPEWDVYLDRPDMEVVNPEHWFGSTEASHELPYQGNIKRWYLKDIMRALKRKNSQGQPLYNKEALEKIKEAMIKGNSDNDRNYRDVTMDRKRSPTQSIEWEDKNQPYVDVIRYNGPLNGINDPGLANDDNEYYIECTRDSLLLWIETPLNRKTMFTHGRTHPHRNRPWGRSYLDIMKPHQQFGDFLMNMSMETITDSMIQQWAVWEDGLEDPNDFYYPKGMRGFLMMGPQGKVPQLLQTGSNQAFRDVKDVLTFLDRDRQRGGTSDQEMGALGGSQDSTATAARILASASSKKIRAGIKRLSHNAILPQVRNLVMLSLVHGKPENLKFIAGDKEVTINQDVVQWWLSESAATTMNDTITRDFNEEAIKAHSAFASAVQILPSIAQPDHAIKMLRYEWELAGIPKRIIDDVIPIPAPPELGNGIPDMPEMPGMPPQMPQGLPQPMPPTPQGPMNAPLPAQAAQG